MTVQTRALIGGAISGGGGGSASQLQGTAILGAFSGSPLVASVVFPTPLASSAYTVLLGVVSASGRSFFPHVENKTINGFDIHLTTTRTFGLSEVTWLVSY